MATLNATPKDVDANSYCTIAECDAYHETHLYADAWNNESSDDRRTAALIWATRLLDEQVEWQGYPTTVTQALRWPRAQVLHRDGQWFLDQNSIPDFLRDATSELARLLLTSDRTKERSIGLTKVKADTVEVIFDKADVMPILPPSVVSMIEHYGDADAGTDSMTMNLERA